LELDDTQSRNQIIKDLKILAGQNKIIESDGKYLIKAESKEYYEGKIDMTGRKQPTLFVREDVLFQQTT
jgi:ribonuclease R